MNRTGQSGLEYAALITVVAAVILSTVILLNGHESPFQRSLTKAFDKVGDKIVHDVEKVK